MHLISKQQLADLDRIFEAFGFQKVNITLQLTVQH